MIRFLCLLLCLFPAGCGAKAQAPEEKEPPAEEAEIFVHPKTPPSFRPQILSHSQEETEIHPIRMEVILENEEKASLQKKNFPLLKQASSEKRKQSLPKNPHVLRVWKVREPRTFQDSSSPLRGAEIDVQAYLATLGIKSVYDLSPNACRLRLPPSPLKGSWNRTGSLKTKKSSLPKEKWEELIFEASRLFGLDPNFIAAVIDAESNFDHLAVSNAGAEGAMQIMPKTQDYLGLKDPFDVKANIHAGCAFLRELLLHFNSTELALAAYNAGSRAVDKYGGIPPYKETQNYVRKVMRLWQEEPFSHKTGQYSKAPQEKGSSR